MRMSLLVELLAVLQYYASYIYIIYVLYSFIILYEMQCTRKFKIWYLVIKKPVDVSNIDTMIIY